MISNIQTDKKLDEFINGIIPYNELDMFFKQGGIDNTNELIEEHQTAITAVNRYNLVSQVQLVHQHFLQTSILSKTKQPAPVVKMSPSKFMIRIAAVLALTLVSVTAFQYLTSTGKSFYNNLYESYTVANTRSIEKASEIVEAYQNGNYKRTTELFAQLNSPGNREFFIAANSFAQLNNTPKAIELYKQILNNNKNASQKFYQDEAEYYLAMAFLQTNNINEALPLLTKIANDKNHTYYSKIDKWTLFKMKWLGHQ
jgi:tetratricopeptide (TPR) repeat protein